MSIPASAYTVCTQCNNFPHGHWLHHALLKPKEQILFIHIMFLLRPVLCILCSGGNEILCFGGLNQMRTCNTCGWHREGVEKQPSTPLGHCYLYVVTVSGDKKVLQAGLRPK